MASETGEDMDYEAEDIEEFEDVEDFEDDDMDDDEGFEDDLDDDDEALLDEEDDDDDDDEAYEEDDDDDDENFDEALEAALEDDDDDDDEGFEEDDDDDEALEFEDVEDLGEAASELSLRGRMRLRAKMRKRLLARRKARARVARRNQIRARRRIRGLQRSLRARLSRIRGPRVRVRKIGRLRGRGVVTARLPNGRTTRMMFSPPLASQTAVNRLAKRISSNDGRQARAIRAQSKAITRLKSAQRVAIKSITTQQLKSTKSLSKRIGSGDAKLDKRITNEMRKQRVAHSRHRTRMMREMRHQQRRSTWNSVLLATSMPLYAAYGARADDDGNPINKKNAILFGSTVGWMVVDELVDRFLVRGSKGRKVLRSGVNIWSYVAPVGNAATVYFALRNEQHERFVTGVAQNVTSDGSPVVVDVGAMVGSSYKSTFEGIASPVVTASIKSSTGSPTGVEAIVANGKLTLTLIGTGATADISWKVDTRKP